MLAPMYNQKGNLSQLVISKTGIFHVIKICYWPSLFYSYRRKEEGTS